MLDYLQSSIFAFIKLILSIVFIVFLYKFLSSRGEIEPYINAGIICLNMLLWTLLAIHDKLVEINNNLKRLNEFNEQQDRNKG